MLTSEMTKQSTKVITMGCIAKCPFTPADKTIRWNIPDPKGRDKQYFIEVRNIIEKQVEQLLKEENLIS